MPSSHHIEGGNALEFRIANERTSQIIELEVQVILSKLENIDGITVRKFHELVLERSRVIFFALA